MFGIGMPEMILILAVALIVIGPKKLPGLAKSLGRALGEFRKATSDLKDSFDIDTSIKDIKEPFNDINNNVKKALDRSMTPEPAPASDTVPTDTEDLTEKEKEHPVKPSAPEDERA